MSDVPVVEMLCNNCEKFHLSIKVKVCQNCSCMFCPFCSNECTFCKRSYCNYCENDCPNLLTYIYRDMYCKQIEHGTIYKSYPQKGYSRVVVVYKKCYQCNTQQEIT